MKKYFLVWMIFQNLVMHAQVFPTRSDRQEIDQMEVINGRLLNIHSAILPLNPLQTVEEVYTNLKPDHNALTGLAKNYLLSHVDVLNESKDSSIQTYFQQGSFKPRLKYFFIDGRNFFSIYRKNFQFSLNPLLEIKSGWQKEGSEVLLTNRHGIRLKLNIDKKVSVYSDITDNQITIPFYVDSFVNLYNAIPGIGLYKSYQSKILKIKQGYDYLLAEGAVNFNLSNHIQISLGHGRHFIGNGLRSLFLSDFAAPQFYLRFNTNIWRLHYQNLFMELSPETLGDRGNQLLPKKYTASHYLSANLTKNWNVGLFESVVFERSRGFELQYLNPVILYRYIEHSLGSPDNVFLGIQTQLLLRKAISVYGQIVFDEFLLKELIDQNGWWGNKYGIQMGVKYVNAFGIKGLNFQSECNLVRPYTYTFRDSFANYSHFNQPLAHPLGANFKEFIFRIDYKPLQKLHLEAKWIYFHKGLDEANLNYGGNILKNYNTRLQDYNNEIAQGILEKVNSINLESSYEFIPESYIDLDLFYRASNIKLEKKSGFWFTAGIRMNLDRLRFEF
ncbi:MAG: hypothetical protein JNL65_08445 [Saprospiraceae bacterium]|nr:hypothetical protein [Saprospiraceae bacterium]